MRTLLKWVLRVVILAVILILVVLWRGSSKVGTSYDVDVELIAIPDDSASVAEGEYLSRIMGCQDCHGADLAGRVLADAPPFLGVATNLTPGGVGAFYTDEDWLRALRKGVAPEGRGLFIMPSDAYTMLSDKEVGSIIAYLKQVAVVENDLPVSQIRTLGKFIAGMGGLYSIAEDIGRLGPRPAMPAKGVTVEWGDYRAQTICTICHGTDLAGGIVPDPASPPAPDLASVKGWTLDGFKTAMRTGVTPGGRQLDGQFMPWSSFTHMTDEELEALYLRLQALSP